MRLAFAVLAIALVGVADAAPQQPVAGWSIGADESYVHDATGMICPKTWGRLQRYMMTSKRQGDIVAACTYAGREKMGEWTYASVIIREPNADASDEDRKLLSAPGTRFHRLVGQKPVIGSRPLTVSRYTIEQAGLLIDCETTYASDTSDVFPDFERLCQGFRKR